MDGGRPLHPQPDVRYRPGGGTAQATALALNELALPTRSSRARDNAEPAIQRMPPDGQMSGHAHGGRRLGGGYLRERAQAGRGFI